MTPLISADVNCHPVSTLNADISNKIITRNKDEREFYVGVLMLL